MAACAGDSHETIEERVGRSLQIDLTTFVRSFAGGVREVTASAFNQKMQEGRPLVFRELMRVLNTEFYTDNDERVLLWEGMRLLAVSERNLPWIVRMIHAAYFKAILMHGPSTIRECVQ